MRAMAIVALGCFHSAQLGDLAMKGLEIGFRHIDMAFAALVQNALPEVINIHSFDGVRKVAIIAHRQIFICFGDVGAVNAFFERLVDTKVALRAGGRDILVVDS